ncbi:hypothetical protein QJS10_CPA08g00955 [Acorus calamus]|uniref:Uncharacterized protein n=1 Tax=Acorus calamus TaxID=4465 RepID=A0AAV9E9C4_ACOCL|nr:hypothetical protein QJS10_CPA08g00955 [Acorus calamus]
MADEDITILSTGLLRSRDIKNEVPSRNTIFCNNLTALFVQALCFLWRESYRRNYFLVDDVVTVAYFFLWSPGLPINFKKISTQKISPRETKWEVRIDDGFLYKRHR